jgi:hypothetical protein
LKNENITIYKLKKITTYFIGNIMKKKYVLLVIAILVIVLTATIIGQTVSNSKKDTTKKVNDLSDVLGKPVYESTADSLNTKVWIISQTENKELLKTTTGKTMGKMKAKNTKEDKSTKAAIISGTHYFIFDVTNILKGKEVADTSAKVEIVSPSKKIISLNLKPMMNHFGDGVTFDEAGDYLFTINLNVGTGYKTTQFKYTVKK